MLAAIHVLICWRLSKKSRWNQAVFKAMRRRNFVRSSFWFISQLALLLARKTNFAAKYWTINYMACSRSIDQFLKSWYKARKQAAGLSRLCYTAFRRKFKQKAPLGTWMTFTIDRKPNFMEVFEWPFSPGEIEFRDIFFKNFISVRFII